MYLLTKTGGWLQMLAAAVTQRKASLQGRNCHINMIIRLAGVVELAVNWVDNHVRWQVVLRWLHTFCCRMAKKVINSNRMAVINSNSRKWINCSGCWIMLMLKILENSAFHSASTISACCSKILLISNNSAQF